MTTYGAVMDAWEKQQRLEKEKYELYRFYGQAVDKYKVACDGNDEHLRAVARDELDAARANYQEAIAAFRKARSVYQEVRNDWFEEGAGHGN